MHFGTSGALAHPQPVAYHAKLKQIRVAASLPSLTAPAARMFSALVASSDDTGRLVLSLAELREMAALYGKGTAADVLLRELSEHGLIERTAGRGGRPYEVRVTLRGDLLVEELDTAARRMREARRGLLSCKT